MIRTSKALILVTACLASYGCTESAADKERRIKAELQVTGERLVKNALRDADSAQFRNQFVSREGAPCGEVNAKNSFGGYKGYSRYIAAGKEYTLIEGENVQPVEFEKIWQQFCRK